jgi:CRISPR system Cascade subunit CasE
MHAAVLACFPQPADERGRVLWRIDQDRGRTWLYVVSEPRPGFSSLTEQAGWPDLNDTWDSRDYSGFLNRLEDGQRWAFRMTANPSHSVRIREGGETKRVGHVTVTQQRQWFLDRAEKWGFIVAEHEGRAEVVVHDRLVERFQRQGKPVTVSKATFDGILIVNNPEALCRTLTEGAGAAKAYGCGLLTLAPPR